MEGREIRGGREGGREEGRKGEERRKNVLQCLTDNAPVDRLTGIRGLRNDLSAIYAVLPYVGISLYLSISLSVCPSIHLSICPSARLLVYTSVRLSTCIINPACSVGKDACLP